ncbi:MAG: hypothetical protein PHH60_05790 [Candidatus Margulisbacteria bacterium]|nr:hypothetical protein [Candidatus Margulisiibacteriota bacterium]
MVSVSGVLLNLWGTVFGDDSEPEEAVTLPGCTAPGEEDSCLSQGGRPAYETPTPPNPQYDYDITDPERPPVVWRIYGIENCNGSIDGISVNVNFGPDGTETAVLTEADDGTLTATITHRFNQQVGYPIPATITGSNGETARIDLSPPSWADPAQPDDVCVDNTAPLVSSLYDIQVDPGTTINEGEAITLSFPAAGITECDESIDHLQVSFIINGISYPATLDGDVWTASATLTAAGTYPYGMLVEDTDRGTFTEEPKPYEATPTITVNATAETCYAIPDYIYDRSPDDAFIYRGANTEFTWTISELDDCNGDPLSTEEGALTSNAAEFLHCSTCDDGPTVEYDPANYTLTVV